MNWVQIGIRIRDVMRRQVQGGATAPEGVVTAPPGTMYVEWSMPRKCWIKETGTGAAGWVEHPVAPPGP